MLSYEDALKLISEHTEPLESVQTTFKNCSMRVLADDLKARSNTPFQNVSAMDGYGVRDSDLYYLPTKLKVTSESFAGSELTQDIPPQSCVRIFTGAPVPLGIDRVVIQENVERDGDYAVFNQPLSDGRNIRLEGSDFKAGDVLLKKGTHLTWRAMTTAASADQEILQTVRIPKAVILATGDELMPPGSAYKRAGSIPESVSFGVSTFMQENGADIVRSERLTDSPALLEKAAQNSLKDADIVVVTGGASVGERDFAKSMFASLGIEMIFSKVAIKPGKPVWFAKAGKTLILGLPGNPTSALVTARLFLKPIILGLSGRNTNSTSETFQITTNSPIPANGSRENFVRAYIEDGKAKLFSTQDSSIQSTLANADLLIRRRPHAPATLAGETVSAIHF